ncbi:hypothetical protein MTO96_050369, partial [Rhipicephalus appendiculatus]
MVSNEPFELDLSFVSIAGIISGALLQIRETFDLSCVVQQLVVGSLFLSAFISSFFG